MVINPGIRVGSGGLVSLSWFSQLYPLRLDAALAHSSWGACGKPGLLWFYSQPRADLSRPFIFQCRSPGQQGLLGDVIVRLCVAVASVLCWHGHVFSCLRDFCPLGCHNSSFFCCGTTGSPFTTQVHREVVPLCQSDTLRRLW